MNPNLIAILAEIHAAQARVLGMHAENQCRESSGDAPAYVARDFNYEATGLEHLAQAARSFAN